GWAKPVPVNPNNFKKYRSGCFWTSAAGIIANYISAFLFAPLFLLSTKYLAGNTYGYLFIRDLTYLLFAYSLSFCIFNLLPFYPLDGFRIVDALNRKRGKVYWFLRKYGYYILLGLIGISFLSRYIPFLGYINILGYVMEFAVNIFGWPIDKFWGLIIR
ncbi:MAG: site-2 protease family protein, partial [Firmicutes bacterium]|nr:site-2 protease family protein [Bacillota bacterium]